MPGTWSTIEIAGKTADIFIPRTIREERGAVLHLHGHGCRTLKDNAAYSQALDAHGLFCICPHGQRSWWMDRACAEFDAVMPPLTYLVEHVVPWIEHEWQIEPPDIALTGISMGGQGALQLAFRHARMFPTVVAISPIIDIHKCYGHGLPLDDMYTDIEDARQATAILQIHPLNYPRKMFVMCDPADSDWFEGAERMRMKLSASGILMEHDFETSHGGHTWEYFNHVAPAAIQFVADAL